MAKEDDNLVLWFDRLRTMQSCMLQINLDTPTDLKAFYQAKHKDLLTTSPQKEQFRSCFDHNTGLSITDNDFSATSTFHELLDEVSRTLFRAVASVFLRVAIENKTVLPATTVTDVLKVSTKTAFPVGTPTDNLCQRLADDMDALFPSNLAGQAPFRALLASDKPVSDAVNSII